MGSLGCHAPENPSFVFWQKYGFLSPSSQIHTELDYLREKWLSCRARWPSCRSSAPVLRSPPSSTAGCPPAPLLLCILGWTRTLGQSLCWLWDPLEMKHRARVKEEELYSWGSSATSCLLAEAAREMELAVLCDSLSLTWPHKGHSVKLCYWLIEQPNPLLRPSWVCV